MEKNAKDTSDREEQNTNETVCGLKQEQRIVMSSLRRRQSDRVECLLKNVTEGQTKGRTVK